jgi:hypothetical protein
MQADGVNAPCLKEANAMFRFTIRDVLWLTVVVALVCGWLSDRARFQLRLAEADARIHQWAASIEGEKARLEAERRYYHAEAAKLATENAPKR